MRPLRLAASLLAALLIAAFALGPAEAKTIYIVAIVPPDTGNVYITGDDATLGNWNPRGALMKADGNKRIFALDALKGDKLSYKFTLGSWDREALGEDGKPPAGNYTLTVGDQTYYQYIVPGFKGDPQRTVYIAAIVPDGTGTLYITGSTPALGPWNPRGAEMIRDGKYRIYAFTAPRGTGLEYKFTLGSWDTEALGEDGKPHPANYKLIVGTTSVYEISIPGFKSQH
jgi:hypothetical protein